MYPTYATKFGISGFSLYIHPTTLHITASKGVKNTDSLSYRSVRPLQNLYSGLDTNPHPVTRLQF